MSHYLLSAEATFSAAHTLPGVPRCERMHGHNWRVRLTVRVAEQQVQRTGMAIDFRVIERALTDATAEFDHRYLNELDAFAETPPTAERVARVIAERTAPTIAATSPHASVEQVEVWEVPAYRVVYRPT
ncbi:MAG: 6-carboxytetrahydropterin synthase [Gemmatimonadales bacterium]|jgi:6-pyruvoyltetrahydropterin/6-carboxytetrahydropterin synthase